MGSPDTAQHDNNNHIYVHRCMDIKEAKNRLTISPCNTHWQTHAQQTIAFEQRLSLYIKPLK